VNPKAKGERVNAKGFVVLDPLLADGAPLEQGAISAAEVLNGDPCVIDDDAGVAARDTDVGQDKIVVFCATQAKNAGLEKKATVRMP
jgi:hypothetical protein